jgi:dihydroflavonol-4-reductase
MKTSLHLITGATGHIGNVLVRQLLARGERVRVLLRPGRTAQALEGLEVERVPGDILELDSLQRALEGVDIAYHLAARVSILPGPDPETERVNLDGTCNMLAAARASGVRRLVYASSIYALRTPASGTIDESCPFDPGHARGAYDRSKAAASLAVLRAAAEGLDAVLVCPTAVAGPFDFQRSEAGRGILYNLTPGIKFLVEGGYDFVDVRDVARGLILAGERGRSGEVYILGGEYLTVHQVSETIWQAAGGWHTGIPLPSWMADLAAAVMPFFTDDPIVTPYSLQAIRSNGNISHARAEAELGYRPRPARQAIREAVAWWLERLAEPELLPERIAKAAV